VVRRCVWSRNIKNGCSIYIYDFSSLRVKGTASHRLMPNVLWCEWNTGVLNNPAHDCFCTPNWSRLFVFHVQKYCWWTIRTLMLLDFNVRRSKSIVICHLNRHNHHKLHSASIFGQHRRHINLYRNFLDNFRHETQEKFSFHYALILQN